MKALRCCFAGIAVMLLSVVCIMMLKGMVAFAYETAGAEIPVYCLRCTADGSREYRLLLEPADDRSPQPEEKDILTGEDSVVRFNINLDEPGTYHYRLSQIPGAEEDTVYDETVYRVTVYAEDDGGKLIYAVTAVTDGDSAKADRIQFENEVKQPVTVTTTAVSTGSTLTTVTTVSGDTQTAAAADAQDMAEEAAGQEGETMTAAAAEQEQVTSVPVDSAKTGDTTDAGELAAIAAAASAAALITRKRRNNRI